MALSMLSSTKQISNKQLKSKFSVRSIFPGITAYNYAMSPDGSTMLFVNTTNNIFISTNYGVSFTQITDTPGTAGLLAISNGGQYINVLIQGGAYNSRICLSNDHGITWRIKEFDWRGGGEDVIMSADGKYIYICSGYLRGIWSNNNYGDDSSWINYGFNISGNLTTPENNKVNGIFAGYISPSGQYVSFLYHDIYNAYSTDFGVSFALITPSTYIFPSQNNNIIYKPSTAVINLARNDGGWQYKKLGILSNESGSLSYFMSNDIMYESTDNLQTVTVYNMGIDSNIIHIFRGSASLKYMFGTHNSQLKLIINNLL